jgi:hypothetical protein
LVGIIIAAILANTNNPKRPQDKTQQQKRSALRDPIVWATIGIFLATAAAVGVAILQWLTLEKTDGTLKDTLATNKEIQRAFMYVKDVWWRPLPERSPKDWWALPNWENMGITPIKYGAFGLGCGTVTGKETIVDPYDLKKVIVLQKRWSEISLVVGPKQNKFGGTCFWPTDTILAGQREEQTLYVLAEAIYTDIFDRERITRFCERAYRFNGDFSAPSPGFNIANIPCTRFNCTDEQCRAEEN